MFDMYDIHRVVNPAELPASLQSLDDCPSILYCVGDVELLNTTCVSVAGARKVNSSSIKWLNGVLEQCSASKPTIVSGLALGTDTVAHKTALELGLPTIAVLPSGVNNIAPRSNEKLANQIVDNGGLLISEYMLHQAPNRDSYINRNRLIASLGKALVVPQCEVKSGTMHTVRFAKQYDKYIVTQDADYSGNQHIIRSGDYKVLIK